jgi:hypothetical protein
VNQYLTRLATFALIGVASTGCSDTTSPSEVTGSYSAIIFSSTGTSGQTNHLLAGSTFDITLHSDGSTSGHLHMITSTGALDADMGGTWTQSGDLVEFAQAADTFVRDMVFRIERIGGNEFFLVGDQIFSGTRINVTLGRDN